MTATERPGEDACQVLAKRLQTYLCHMYLHLGRPAGTMDGETLVHALMAHLSIPVIETNPRQTWVWSDLHLEDNTAWKLWKRPFASPRKMSEALLRAWERNVGPTDTVLFLGDIAFRETWKDWRLNRRIQGAPGQRWLVLGNHDVHHTRSLTTAGFGRVTAAAVYHSDPPLMLTHPPLEAVPEGVVNVHGHIHGAETHGRRINVSVEQTGWEPVRMDRLLARIRNEDLAHQRQY